MKEKFNKQDQLSAVQEAGNLNRDKKNTESDIEVKKAILNPESIKNLPFSKLADLLNRAGCNNYLEHPLKNIIYGIIDKRYPHSDGWTSFEGNAGYIDSWIRDKDGKQVGIQCEVSDFEPNEQYTWSGYEAEEEQIELLRIRTNKY
jgi:hypothetical protein